MCRTATLSPWRVTRLISRESLELGAFDSPAEARFPILPVPEMRATGTADKNLDRSALEQRSCTPSGCELSSSLALQCARPEPRGLGRYCGICEVLLVSQGRVPEISGL